MTRATWDLFKTLLRQTYEEWDRDNASTLAAALAYYAAFATAPLLVLLVAALGPLVGTGVARREVERQALLAMGDDGARLVGMLLDNASRPGSSMLAAILGGVTLLVTVSGLFVELSRSLAIVWNVPPPPSTSIATMLRERAWGFSMVLAGGVFLLASLLSSATLSAAEAWLGARGGASLIAFYWANVVVSFAGMTALFAIAFKLLSGADVSWRDVWGGALVTGGLFMIGKVLLGLYFSRLALASSFGAAGSLAVFLAWVYYTAQIFFIGAELTQVWTRHRASRAGALPPGPPGRLPPPDRRLGGLSSGASR